jgi:lysophospholipase L1-like esterase
MAPELILYTLQIGATIFSPNAQSEGLFLTVADVRGAYRIPYIQADPNLDLRIAFHDPELDAVRVRLEKADREIESATLRREQPTARFTGLAKGEYSLHLSGIDAEGEERTAACIGPVGIGAVIAAIGDSITEGYYGAACYRDDLNLVAEDFSPDDVSKDRRNFPQYAPTTSVHKPEVNCMRSWMTDLNDLLAESLGYPIFIANEGWGGYQTSNYLKLMLEDNNWNERMHLLAPDIWLIHLGVNDERARLGPEDLKRNLEEIVETLIHHHGAAPARVFLARPCYDYAEGADPVLRAYCKAIDELISEKGLSRGPDFFTDYSEDRKKYYGDDPVHPNLEGMKRMAELWRDSIVEKLRQGSEPSEEIAP